MPAAELQHTPTAIAPEEEAFYAPDFSMDSLAGESYTLTELRGQWVLINFWATWCVPCREEMPVLQLIAEEQADDWLVLGINQRETVDIVQPFVTEYGLTFPILMNPDDTVLVDYAVMSLPQTVVVDPDGIVVWRQFGPLELDTFAETLTLLQA